MTSRERFYSLFRKKMPDRIPITLFIQHQGHFIHQVFPDVDAYDTETLNKKVIQIQRELGVDCFVRLLFDPEEAAAPPRSGVEINKQSENWEVITKKRKEGNTHFKESVIKTPLGTLTQEFAASEIEDGTFVLACTKKPIQTKEDVKIVEKYEPAASDQFRELVNKSAQNVSKELGEDGIVGMWAPNGPFNNASHLINIEDLYSLPISDPEFYKKLMRLSLKRIIPYARILGESNVDVIIISGNVAGGFVGKNYYEEYVLPYEKQFVQVCQDKGIPALYHNCGEIMNLIESYKKLGIKWVEPFSPPPLGDGQISRVKETVGNEYIITGGIDQVNVLKKGKPEEVRNAVKNTIRKGKPKGNFVLQSADFLEYGTPLENLEAFVSTAKEYAWYESSEY